VSGTQIAPVAEMWQGQNRHLQYSDDPPVIDSAVLEITDWFARHLGPVPSRHRTGSAR
jgi:hypothetical protein